MRTGISSRGTLSLRLILIFVATINDRVNSTPTTSSSSVVKNLTATFNKMTIQRSIETSRKFTCKEPQQRAYNLRDLMQNLGLQNSGETTTLPVYMVLKRCDGYSGCCMSPHMTCSPVQSSTYFEDFEIQMWSLATNDTRQKWIRVEQHGSCYCELTNPSDSERFDERKPNVTILR